MPRTMAYGRCGSTHLVLVHGATPPSDAEWRAYIADLTRWGPELVGLLIVTEGGGLSSAQRRLLRDRWLAIKLTLRVAVVSESLLVRGVVIALGAYDTNIRAFRPDAMDEALAHVRAILQGPQLLEEVRMLKASLRT